MKYLKVSLLCLFWLNQALSQNILSPQDFLPHQLGDQFTPHHLLVDYLKHLAERSQKVKLIEYGHTNEGRPLFLAFISNADNIQRLEEIRVDNLKRAGIISGQASNQPISIVWLSFSVHGNEACGSEASMPVIYELITNPQAARWLEHSVVIIDPAVNPDGYSRYTNWNRQVVNRILTPDYNSLEHHEPWPGGRTNHYYFDLNRDWAWQSQIESKQRIVQYKKWLPHIVADFHEMGYQDPYYFAPAAQPYHELITPWQRDFQVTIGKNHAKYFSANGWLFYTKETFDLFYPSYGDTYPTYHGAIGMTYEQGGSGTASRGILLPTGDTLTLHDRIAHHVTTALSTVEMGAVHHESVVQEFEKFYHNRKPLKYSGFLIKNTYPAKVKLLCELLDLNHITYGTILKPTTTKGLTYTHLITNTIQVDSGDLFIPVDQPYAVLTHILFEPQPALSDSMTYDITAWALPYAFGLEAYALNEKLTFSPGYSPQPVTVPTEKLFYAYAIPWTSSTSVKALSYLLKNKIIVRYVTESFVSAGRNFPAGTLLVLRGDNRKNGDYHHLIGQLAIRWSIPVTPLDNGFSSSGPDFGSDRMVIIKPQNILVVGREGVNSNAFGQIWHFFEQIIEYPLTVIKPDDLRRIDLATYHCLVMPEGSYALDKNTMDKVRAWVSNGGKVLAIGSAINNLRADETFALKEIKIDQNKDSISTPFAARYRHDISEDNPGSIFKVKLDKTHPLSFGLKDPYFTLKTNTLLFEKMQQDWNVGYLDNELFHVGFTGSKLVPKLKNSLVFGKRSLGRGSIVYMVDNPLFRAFWEEGRILFANALFF